MKRIKYVSEYAEPLSGAAIDEIAAAAAEKNRELGVTGVLMAAGRLFFQILEGPDATIDALYAKIVADTRHCNVLTLAVEQREDLQRLFPDWSMAKMVIDSKTDVALEPVRVILQTVVAQSRITAELVGSLERALWRELVEADGGRA
jgi:hypothetical protein